MLKLNRYFINWVSTNYAVVPIKHYSLQQLFRLPRNNSKACSHAFTFRVNCATEGTHEHAPLKYMFVLARQTCSFGKSGLKHIGWWESWEATTHWTGRMSGPCDSKSGDFCSSSFFGVDALVSSNKTNFYWIIWPALNKWSFYVLIIPHQNRKRRKSIRHDPTSKCWALGSNEVSAEPHQ